MTEYLDLPSKSNAILLTFEYGDPAKPMFKRLTNLQNDLIFKGSIYQSLPAMDIKLSPNVGTLDAKPSKIKLPLDCGNDDITAFVTALSHDRPFSKTQIDVNEIFYSRNGALGIERIYYLRSGEMGSRRRAPSGNPGIVEIELIELKARLDRRMGVVADQYCQALYGGIGCGLEVRTLFNGASQEPGGAWPHAARPFLPPRGIAAYLDFTNRGFVVSIFAQSSGLNAWLRTPTTNPGHAYWWQNGYFEKDGIRLKVREWKPNTHTFVLQKAPPKEWVGSVDGAGFLYPGCGKMISHCRNWDNEYGQPAGNVNGQNGFASFGFAIPAYDPEKQEGNK